MKALDLFCGAGGMALGANKAGIHIIQSVEIDRYSADTYSSNFKDTDIFCDDIKNFSSSYVKFKPDIIFGGPPCQGYSTSNQRTRSKSNPTNWLFEEFLRIVDDLGPEWVVIENVKGLKETESGFFFKEIIGRLTRIGYAIDYFIPNAMNFGVPQKRSRLFIVGNKKNKHIFFPEKNNTPYVTVKEAIGDLPVLENGANISFKKYRNCQPSFYANKLRNKSDGCTNNLVTLNSPHIIERYKHVPPGGNWGNIPENLMDSYHDRMRCHTGIYHRLNPNEPAVVIGNFRKNMLIHPHEDRGLSVREAARIQSFPDSFEFSGSIGFQQQQVGNAVPPLLAEAIFTYIINS